MGDRVDLAQMAEKLVAEPLPLRGAAHQPGDIDEFELGRHDLRRFREAGADLEALVRHRDPADIGFDRVENGYFVASAAWVAVKRVEQGRLADIRQADDPQLKPMRQPSVMTGVRTGKRSAADANGPAVEAARPPRS